MFLHRVVATALIISPTLYQEQEQGLEEEDDGDDEDEDVRKL